MEHQSGESEIRMAAELQILPRNRLSCFYSQIRATGSHLTFISFDLMPFSLPSFDFGSEPSLFLPLSLSFTKDFFVCVSFDVIQQDIVFVILSQRAVFITTHQQLSLMVMSSGSERLGSLKNHRNQINLIIERIRQAGIPGLPPEYQYVCFCSCPVGHCLRLVCNNSFLHL